MFTCGKIVPIGMENDLKCHLMAIRRVLGSDTRSRRDILHFFGA